MLDFRVAPPAAASVRPAMRLLRRATPYGMALLLSALPAPPRAQAAAGPATPDRTALARRLVLAEETAADTDRMHAFLAATESPAGQAALADLARAGVPGAEAGDWSTAAQWLKGAGRLTAAATAFRAASTLEPDNPEYPFRLAGVQGAMWDLDGAIATYGQILDSEFVILCHYNIGLMELRAERYQAAVAAFDRCLDAGGVPHVVLPHKATALFRLGRFAEAEAAATQALSYDPGAPEIEYVWRLLGRILLAQDLPQAAREAFARATGMPTAEPASFYWLGRAELALKRPRAALPQFRRALDRGFRSPELGYWAGRAAQQAGDPDLAEFAYTRALKLAGGHADAWAGLAALDQLAGKYPAARRCYERALALGSRSPDVHLGLGELAAAEGDTATAVAELERAVALDPTLAAAWGKLGAVYAERGDVRAARRAFARAYTPERMRRDLDRWLTRFFWGVMFLGAFAIVVIVGSRLRRPPAHLVGPLFRARLDLAAVVVMALLVPIALFVVSRRMLYVSFAMQRLSNRQILGLSSVIALRDLVFLAALPLGYLWWRHGRPQFAQLHSGPVLRQVALGLAGFLAFTIPGVLIALARNQALDAGIFPRGPSLLHDSPQNLAASLIGIGIVSSVAQEIFYRGVLYPLTRAQVGVVAAALLSALLFAAFHFQPAGFLWFTAFGLLTAALYERTQSIVAPAVMHVLYNCWQVLA